MNPQVKTPKSVYVTLAAGFVLGAVAMGSFYTGVAVDKAFAASDAKARAAGSFNAESLAELKNLNTSFANLAEFVGPAVVDIRATKGRSVGPDGERVAAAGGEGSGFIYRPDGYILTNDHVVGGFDKVMVTLRDGREFQGKVLRSEDSDIAVVKIEANDLPTLAFADTKVRPGEFSMAVGAPFGFQNSVTVGHVSALGRSNVIGSRAYTDLIQTDTSINMGNSGGPLVNIDGQVIGINTAIYSPTGVSAGIGFAIPSNRAHIIADQLIKDGKVRRAMLGLVPTDLKEFEAKQLKVDSGAKVESVKAGTASDKAGIKKDDIVVKIGTSAIHSEVELRDAMFAYAPNTTVPVEVIRGGQHKTFQVKLDAYVPPATQQQQMMQEMPQRGFGIPKGFGEENPFKDFPGFPKGDDSRTVPPVREGQARLGIQVSDATERDRAQFNIPSNVKGAVVQSVEPGSVGEKLNLKPGDVILAIGGKSVTDSKSLVDAMQGTKWGDTKSVKYSRFGGSGETTITTDVKFR